jgi:hypothetical protein
VGPPQEGEFNEEKYVEQEGGRRYDQDERSAHTKGLAI